MLIDEAHMILDEAEIFLASQQKAVAFDVHSNATRGNTAPQFYENQFANDQQRPLIVYNAQQDLYYFMLGPRQTPCKRLYPLRVTNGIPTESQPQYYYATTQAVDYSRILSITNDNRIVVDNYGMAGWPTEVPFYLYLAQRVLVQEQETFRYVKINDETPKFKVTAIDGNILTVDPLPPTLDDLNTHVYYLVFFNYPVDKLIDTEITLFVGDESFQQVVIGDTTPIIREVTQASFTIEIVRKYTMEEVLEEESFLVPQGLMLLLTRAESQTVINYFEVEILKTVEGQTVEVYLYSTDPSNPDVPDIPDPEDPNNPDFEGELTATGIQRTTTYTVHLTEQFPDLGNELAYYSKAEYVTSDISDDELKVPLPGTEWSLRPHTSHPLAPLKAAAYSAIYGFNRSLPLPYPDETTNYDCVDPIINGYTTPRILAGHRMTYRRFHGTWIIGGTVFPTVRSLSDAQFLRDCFVHRNFAMYFKLEQEDGTMELNPLAVRKWI